MKYFLFIIILFFFILFFFILILVSDEIHSKIVTQFGGNDFFYIEMPSKVFQAKMLAKIKELKKRRMKLMCCWRIAVCDPC